MNKEEIAQILYDCIQSVYFAISGSMMTRQNTLVSKVMCDAGIRAVFVLASYGLKDDKYVVGVSEVVPMLTPVYPDVRFEYDSDKKMSYLTGTIYVHGNFIEVCRLYPDYDLEQIEREITIRKT